MRLDGVNVVGVDFYDSKGLQPETLDNVFGSLDTRLPEGLSHPDHWFGEKFESESQAEVAYEDWLAKRKANCLPPFEQTDA